MGISSTFCRFCRGFGHEFQQSRSGMEFRGEDKMLGWMDECFFLWGFEISDFSYGIFEVGILGFGLEMSLVVPLLSSLNITYS